MEVDISSGIPTWEIVGLPDTSVKESKERIKTAIRNSGIELKSRRYIINLSPASFRKDGAVLDLAIAVAILKVLKIIKSESIEDIFIGELSLNGDVKKVNGILPICIEAVKLKKKRVFIPFDNYKEASIAKGLEIIPVKNLREIIKILNCEMKPIKPVIENDIDKKEVYDIDFSEVKGQENIKRALEIAAAGGHNCLLIGPPRCRKNNAS